jgi:peptide/nickel transport system ATP-binding protein
MIRCEEVRVTYRRGGRVCEALRGISLALGPGESLGLAGGSGSGKTTLARVLVRLVPPTAGRVLFEEQDIARLSRADAARYRKRVQMVFQDSAGALNPRMRAGQVLEEAVAQTVGLRRSARAREAERLLDDVGLDAAHASAWPHELSGGQRQRLGIARALAADPAVLIADEPVSSLDVSVQARILTLLNRLRRERGLALLFIGHDLAVIRSVCERLAVMDRGRVVEQGPVDEVLSRPSDPATRLLIEAAGGCVEGDRNALP